MECAYGIDLDAIAFKHELVRIEGRWYGEQAKATGQFGDDEADAEANVDADVGVEVEVKSGCQ